MVDEELAAEPEVIDASAEDAPEVDETTEQTAEPTLDDIATEMGWSPKENWRGDPEKWKPASEYVRTTSDINRNLTARLKGVEETLSNVARTSASLTDRAVAAERERVLSERQEAFDTGDRGAFDAADEKLRTLVVEPSNSPPPEAQEFASRNEKWFGKDQEATAWARGRAGQLAEQGLSPAVQLEVVEREAQQYFPKYFTPETPKARPAPLNKPGARSAGRSGSKSYANLPSEAKTAADMFHKSGRCTREQYAEEYYAEQGD